MEEDQVVYYESLKRELKTKTIYGFRCDESLKTKVEESTRLVYTVLFGELNHPKDRDEVNKLETPKICRSLFIMNR